MTHSTLQIQDRTVGIGHRTLVIAEIGVNHDGSLRRAIELVELAAAAGADAVKLQIFTADALMHGSSQFADYQQKQVNDANPAQMLRRYELSPQQVREVVAAIRKRGLLPIATPFSPSDVAIVGELDLPALKVASPDLVNRPLLARIAELGKPMIVSTGAATIEEVEESCRWLRQWQASFALLHCISSYPTPASEANLCWITEMAQRFTGAIGFSDHTTEVAAGALAVAAGASLIEKHLTYDRGAKGPDHAASADPQQFGRYVQMIRQAEMLRGLPGKHVLEIEQDVRKVSRQSLVAVRDLATGQLLAEQDLTVQRPGSGIPAAQVTEAVGRRITQPVKRGTLLQWDMLSDAA